MIKFENVTITYSDAVSPVLRNVELSIPEGELCLVIGRTGSGKSTLLQAVNGLVPHFTGGTLTGRVTVAGRDTRTHPPRELADVVGVVLQDPLSGFVTDVVEDELAYGMECLGLPGDVMRRRVEETLDLLGLADLRARPLRSLSGGERQRVAIGSVLTSHPRVLVLDEPTSALDPGAAEDVLGVLHRLVHDLGLTVLLAEHRLERVVQYADRIVIVPGDGRALVTGNPAEVMRSAPVAPPIVELGRLAGWSPLPLTIRDARRAATELRSELAGRRPPLRLMPAVNGPDVAPEIVAGLDRVVVVYGRHVALAGVSLAASRGEVVALMGRNGAGKSTLLSALVGLVPTRSGNVTVLGTDPATLAGRRLVRRIGLVPQDPTDLLYADTVAAECTSADEDAGAPPGATATLLADLAADIDPLTHPRDLSEGQRLALALAVVLVGEPPLLLLDEPTRGLDYAAKDRLVEILSRLAGAGHAVVLATHDVELVAQVATRVIILAEGEIVADGPAEDVITSSPMFAPQIAKVLAPQNWLTVSQVARSVGAAG
jgi:energy-coupling factor transporter ATP-binding protein EcfA2